MKKDKIAPYEKQLIKGMISMYIARGIELDVYCLENDVRHITENNNCSHRDLMEEYIKILVGRTERGGKTL